MRESIESEMNKSWGLMGDTGSDDYDEWYAESGLVYGVRMGPKV